MQESFSKVLALELPLVFVRCWKMAADLMKSGSVLQGFYPGLVFLFFASLFLMVYSTQFGF